MDNWILWGVFGIIVAGMLALDLGVLHRRPHAVGVGEALVWTAVWVALALGFGLLVFLRDGPTKGTEYLTCWLSEYALSIDNIFVFLVIFTYFGVPEASQHRVLFWGILGALVMRGLFLMVGVALIERFHWTVYILGAILLLTGIKLVVQKEEELEPERNIVLRLARRFLPVTTDYAGASFFVRRDGRRYATPLFLALLVVETTDVLFAVDSVPAALGISRDTFILYTSNIFAILGLRSLFFAVAGLLRYLHYLRYGLSAILCFIGLKMIASHWYTIPVHYALPTVGGILAVSVLASLLHGRRELEE